MTSKHNPKKTSPSSLNDDPICQEAYAIMGEMQRILRQGLPPTEREQFALRRIAYELDELSTNLPAAELAGKICSHPMAEQELSENTFRRLKRIAGQKPAIEAKELIGQVIDTIDRSSEDRDWPFLYKIQNKKTGRIKQTADYKEAGNFVSIHDLPEKESDPNPPEENMRPDPRRSERTSAPDATRQATPAEGCERAKVGRSTSRGTRVNKEKLPK